MNSIKATDVPESAFLKRYADHPDCITDAYVTEIAFETGLPALLYHFYTSWLFRLERWVLERGLRISISDQDARDLALGQTNSFAVWEVEDRDETQALLRVRTGRFCSWFMVEQSALESTRLYFGSAVLPREDGQSPGLSIRALYGFHVLYSRALLSAARKSLIREAESSIR